MGIIERLEREASAGVSAVMAFASLLIGTLTCSLLIRFDAEVSRFLYVFILVILQGLCVWSERKLQFGYHLLRFPIAFWFPLVAATLSVGSRHFDLLKLVWVACVFSPLWLLGCYSLWQFRKPNGKQLDLPVGLVHRFKRLEWRWLTPPKWDFWFVWLGLLFSPLIGGSFVFGEWTHAYGHGWLIAAKVVWFLFLLSFVWQWIRAPIQRDDYKAPADAALMVRSWGIFYGFCESMAYNPTAKSTWQLAHPALLLFGITFLFERAFERCGARQSQKALVEYEALEGPSVGL